MTFSFVLIFSRFRSPKIIPSEEQAAEILPKPLQFPAFSKLRKKLRRW